MCILAVSIALEAVDLVGDEDGQLHQVQQHDHVGEPEHDEFLAEVDVEIARRRQPWTATT